MSVRNILVQLVALLGIAISFFLILLGAFAEPPRDIRQLAATLQIEGLVKALESYKADCGKYPSAREGLHGIVLDYGVKGWRGPYLDRLPADPWGQPYVYLL